MPVTFRRPPLTVIAPVRVELPESSSTPLPVFVRPRVPTPPFCKMPLKVVLVFAAPTVRVAAVEAWLFCTVPVPAKDGTALLTPLSRRMPVPLTTMAELTLRLLAMVPCRMPPLLMVVVPL